MPEDPSSTSVPLDFSTRRRDDLENDAKWGDEPSHLCSPRFWLQEEERPFTTGRDDLEHDAKWGDELSPTFVPRDFGSRMRDDPYFDTTVRANHLFLTQRGELHLLVSSKRGYTTQRGGLHPLVVSSSLFSTQRGSVDLPFVSSFPLTQRKVSTSSVCRLPFFRRAGRSASPRRLPFALPLMPNTKRHPCWCLSVFGVFSSPYNTCRIFLLFPLY